MSKTPKTLTDYDAFKFMDELLSGHASHTKKKKTSRNFCMAALMLDAGLRVGEVVQLLVTDLYSHGGPVEQLVITAEITKTGRERTIPTTDRIKRAIKSMWEQWWCNQIGGPPMFAFYVLSNSKHITTRQVEIIVTITSIKAFGRAIHPHVLRHTFASRLMRTVNIRIVQVLLGHKHLSTTQIYTHPNQEDLKKAINSIEK